MGKLNLELFETLLSNGLLLEAVVERYSDEELKKVLDEYVNEMNNETDEVFKDEFLFYEEKDKVVLRRLGFEVLISE